MQGYDMNNMLYFKLKDDNYERLIILILIIFMIY